MISEKRDPDPGSKYGCTRARIAHIENRRNWPGKMQNARVTSVQEQVYSVLKRNGGGVQGGTECSRLLPCQVCREHGTHSSPPCPRDVLYHVVHAEQLANRQRRIVAQRSVHPARHPTAQAQVSVRQRTGAPPT